MKLVDTMKWRRVNITCVYRKQNGKGTTKELNNGYKLYYKGKKSMPELENE